MTCHYPDLGSASDWLKDQSDLGSTASLVWNFCPRFLDAILWGNQCWHCKIRQICVNEGLDDFNVFSGVAFLCSTVSANGVIY